MKNIFKLLFTASILLFAFACTTDGEHLASHDHSGEVEYGAVLRTINEMPSNSLINTSFDDSAFIITVEEQDIEDGGLLQEMRISVVYDDYSPDNGITEASGLVQSVPASEFYTDTEFGLPRYDINVSWGSMKDYVSSSNGNNGQETGDPFLDYDDNLEINVNGWGNLRCAYCKPICI